MGRRMQRRMRGEAAHVHLLPARVKGVALALQLCGVH
jgi:hypothetical protein